MRTTTAFVCIAVLLGAASVVGCTSATGAAGSGPAAVVPPRVCPYGHAAIKAVPVQYGLPSKPMPPELRRRIDNLEVVLGGCCYEPGHSPDEVFVCTRCRYEYDPSGRSWGRSDDDPATFERPLSAPVRRFPLAREADARHLWYSQAIKGGKVECEFISFETAQAVAQVADRVERLIRGYGQTPEPRVDDMIVVRQTCYHFRINGAYGEVSLLPLAGPGRHGTAVTFTWPTEPPLDDVRWASTRP